MESPTDKVRHMHEYKETEGDELNLNPSPAQTSRDMSVAALIISILAVVLLVIFFFGLNSNVKGLSQEVTNLKKLEGTVADMGQTVVTVQGRVAELEKLPARTRNMVIGHMLEDVAQSTLYLSSQVQDEEQGQKLKEAMSMIREVSAQLEK